MVRRGPGPCQRNPAPDRQQGGCDAHFAGLPERRRRGTHTQSGLSDLRLGVEAHRRPHPALRPERRERLAARFRSAGENGPVRCETDVVQLPQHAYGSQRFARAVRKTRRLRPQAQHRDLPR